jgi:hypothetical protein
MQENSYEQISTHIDSGIPALAVSSAINARFNRYYWRERRGKNFLFGHIIATDQRTVRDLKISAAV